MLTSNIFWTVSRYHVLNNRHHRLTGIITYFKTDFYITLSDLVLTDFNIPLKLATLGKQDEEK